MIYAALKTSNGKTKAEYFDKKSFEEEKYSFIQLMETEPFKGKFIQAANTERLCVYIGNIDKMAAVSFIVNLDANDDYDKYYIFKKVTEFDSNGDIIYPNRWSAEYLTPKENIEFDKLIDNYSHFEFSEEDINDYHINPGKEFSVIGENYVPMYKSSGISMVYDHIKTKSPDYAEEKTYFVMTVIIQLNRHLITMEDILQK